MIHNATMFINLMSNNLTNEVQKVENVAVLQNLALPAESLIEDFKILQQSLIMAYKGIFTPNILLPKELEEVINYRPL